MNTKLEAYCERRENILKEITEALSTDERFVAAWLTGSYGKNNTDEVSDIDLNIVVKQSHTTELCKREEQASHQTTKERLALFSQFGKPALIHENNNNAPQGGTFTFVLYSDSALTIDWTLISQENAERPYQSLLLFDKANIPVSLPPQPPELAQSKKSVAEQWAFFWMMTAVTIKYIIRGDSVFVTQWIENLNGIVHDIERQISKIPWSYTRGSLSQIQPTAEKQVESIRAICKRMQELQPKAVEFAESGLLMPLEEIETLLSFAKK